MKELLENPIHFPPGFAAFAAGDGAIAITRTGLPEPC